MNTTTAPAPWPGTEDEKRANRRTHWFGPEDRCERCDCRPWGRTAEWPCGASIPRVTYTGAEADAVVANFMAGAMVTAWAREEEGK